MALQLLNRPYAGLGGYDQPKILKLPGGTEYRGTRRSPNVDVGDVMMNMRMDNGKNRYIQEHVSKYSQGLSPYGEYGQPYKIKVFRPPIIDPSFYEALSRKKIKSNQVTSGPIVSSLYKKQQEISKISPKVIIDRVCPDTSSNPSMNIQTHNNKTVKIKELCLKQPRATMQYHPSIPIYKRAHGTGVPKVELNPTMIVRPNMGIHAPFTVSDQSRDIRNMRTPTHVAIDSSLKIPGSTVDNNFMHKPIDLTPKVQTAAWYNPSYFLGYNSGYGIREQDNQKCLQEKIYTNARTNASWIGQESERGVTKLEDVLHPGSFEGKVYGSGISSHPEFTRIRSENNVNYNPNMERFTTQFDSGVVNNNNFENAMKSRAIRDNLPRSHGDLQDSRVDKTYIDF